MPGLGPVGRHQGHDGSPPAGHDYSLAVCHPFDELGKSRLGFGDAEIQVIGSF
jgi:hypothetical protein